VSRDGVPLEHGLDGLPATGERTAPGLPHEEYWFARHLVAYHWSAQRLSSHGVVVDAGAGEGYGPSLLPGRLRLAVDYDRATCAHMRAHYPTIAPVTANLAALPIADESVDAVVTLQVLEHIWNPLGFLAEARRILRAGGRLLLTTPNRLTFSPGLGRGEKPANPFHVEEFDAEQVRSLLKQAGFADIGVFGLHHGPRLQEWESTHGSLVAAQVTAMTTGKWSVELGDMVSSVTAADFEFSGEVQTAQDLVAQGVA